MIGELVRREIAKALLDQPQVDVRDGVVDVKIFLQVQCVDELPRVLVEHEARDQGLGLNLRALAASLEEGDILEPGHGPAELTSLCDVLVHRDEFQGFVEIVLLELGLCIAKVLGVVHAVVLLVLVPVQIRDAPDGLVLREGLVAVSGLLLELGAHVMPLDVEFKWA